MFSSLSTVVNLLFPTNKLGHYLHDLHLKRDLEKSNNSWLMWSYHWKSVVAVVVTAHKLDEAFGKHEWFKNLNALQKYCELITMNQYRRHPLPDDH
ncbi:hypothetical protein DERF_004744 [Dermatophagoides farinae]|uniref:Uncharacterized protein n=1 Tax=Dermatophagoides farinae TaxID=6954 RepID=A0A922LAF6_DERFA|nr:hypothetical protein DERF_004744 [Dermatophagoides farinae]